MKEEQIDFIVNKERVKLLVNPHRTLLNVLREELGLKGTKAGCEQGECGACTVILDGRTVNSCLVPMGKVQGSTVETIEGLSKDGQPDPLQQSFLDHGALQCGFCTPGMIMSARALLKENPLPEPEEVRRALSGNLCRCTGYVKIIDAVLNVGEEYNSQE